MSDNQNVSIIAKDFCLPVHECTNAMFTSFFSKAFNFLTALFVVCVSHINPARMCLCLMFLNWGTGSLSVQLYLFHGIFSPSKGLSGFQRPVCTRPVLKIQPPITSQVNRVAQSKLLLKFAYDWFLSL